MSRSRASKTRRAALRAFWKQVEQAGNTSYRKLVQRDPCSYCFGPGGTADHIDPKGAFKSPPMSGHYEPLPPAYGAFTNLTGACERCNFEKDRAASKALSPLEMLLRNAVRSTTEGTEDA